MRIFFFHPDHNRLYAICACCMLLLWGNIGLAADSYDVCTRTPRNDLTFLQQSDGSMLYNFSGDLKCHTHFNFEAFHSTAHDTADQHGTYRVEASSRNNRFHERIWIDMPGHYGGAPAIKTTYTCQADPLRFKNPHCQKIQQSTPNPSTWQKAVVKAGGLTTPISLGLASRSILEDAVGIHAGPTEPPAGQADSNTAPLVTDVAFLKGTFSDIGRQYFFSFSTPVSGRTEKVEARATRQINAQTVDISLSGAGHNFSMSYRCDSMMDPFLDPDNKCTLTGTPSVSDSLRQGLVKQNSPLVSLFSHAISEAKRRQLVMEALATSMRPAIIVKGKSVAQDNGYEAMPGSAQQASEIRPGNEIMLKVESARDVKRIGEQPVQFIIENSDCPTCPVIDSAGKKIHFPLSGKYSGNSYNTTVQTIPGLAPGSYRFFTRMSATLFKMIESKKIPFTVKKRTISLMHRGLAILSPKEGQSYTGTIPVRISLPETMKKKGKLTLTWAQVGNGAARLLKQRTITVKPAVFFESEQDIGELVAKADKEVGEIQLSISLEGSDKHDAARFHVGILGTPVQNPGQKMSGHLSLAHKGLHSGLATKMQMNKKQAQETGIRSINPQPEPPGKVAQSMKLPLRVVPVAKRFQLPASVPIQIRNTPFRRLPFEVRYRTGSTGPYKAATRISHKFARKNGQTTLILHPDRPGQYQVRFRANHKSAWTPWQSFQVTGPNRAAHLARNMQLQPVSTRAINPQPEPPGTNARMLHTTMRRPKGHLGDISTTNTLTAKPISIVTPTILTPKNGQKFMLTGNSIHIQARIGHANGQKIKVQVEQKRKGGFVPIRKGVQVHPGTTQSSVDILAGGPGAYRLRVKNSGNRATWSRWTTFTLDRLMQYPQQLNVKKPAAHNQRVKQTTPKKATIPAAMQLPNIQ